MIKKIKNDGKATLIAVGDVGFRIEENNDTFDHVRTLLKDADISLGQLEVLLSGRGPQQVHFPGFEASDIVGPSGWAPNPEAAVKVLVDSGFDIMSFSSNHALDMGYDDMFATLDILRKNDIVVFGAGRNIEEARQPAILERRGTKIGFLAYCSVVPKGYEATTIRGGVAPMRATTAYEQVHWQAGFPPMIITKAKPDELAEMVEDIQKLRPRVDILVVSMHWGIPMVPELIADYQFEVGHAAVDAGADIIIGQHPHILKGIEVYKGKVIFYSLGQFSMRRHKEYGFTPVFASGRYWITRFGIRAEADPNCPRYPYDINARKTIIVKCDIEDKKLQRVSYVPFWMNKEAVPEVVSDSDSRSEEYLSYMQRLCGSQGLDTTLSVEGDQVVVST